MHRKRFLALVSTLVVAGFVLAACGGAVPEVVEDVVDTAAQEQIAALEAQLAELQASGAATEDEIAALQAELDAASGELKAASAAQCSYNAYRLGWVMDWADAGNIVDTVFGPTSDFQYSFWQLSEPDAASAFGDLTLSAYRDTDLENRAATWQEAERILVDDVVAVLPIYHYDRSTLVSTDVEPLFPPFGAPRMADWGASAGKTDVRWAAGASVPTLDINRSTDTTSSTVIYQMIDAPYKFNAEGGIEPLAAESFEVSDDGTVFTVNLRQDAVWSDGEPVTAQHYVDGVKRLLSPDLANDYAYVMFDIVGAADYNAGDLARRLHLPVHAERAQVLLRQHPGLLDLPSRTARHRRAVRR